MITNAQIKQIRSLREKKFRDELGLFVVEGEKMVAEAQNSRFDVVSVWRRDEIGDEAMSRISQFTSPPPVLAVVRKPAPQPVKTVRGLCLALDGVRDPGNMGTIIRLSDWFGISAVYVSGGCVEVFNPKVIQASMGSIFRVDIISADIPGICARFRSEGMQVFGTFLDGSDIYRQDLPQEGLIIMGNESEGISPETAAQVSSRLYIPPFGNSGAESLNVATAAAITLSEFRRRQ